MRHWTATRALAQVSMLVALVNACLLFIASSGDAQAQSDPIRIVAFGDSLTAGYGLKPSEAFRPNSKGLAGQGVRRRGNQCRCFGDTTAAGLERFDWAFPEDVDGNRRAGR